MVYASLGGLALPAQPSGLRRRLNGSFSSPEPCPLARQRSRGSRVCHTRDHPDSSSFPSAQAIPHGANGLTGMDTFQQLRQAVLSSLDYADVAVDPLSSSWETEDDHHAAAESSDESSHTSYHHGNGAQPGQGKAAYEGKSVYETLRIDKAGKSRRVYVRRRDLIRSHGLQLRDLRRVDPSLSPTKTAPSVAIKEECVLINIGGVRAVITADRCLLFEPSSASSRKFVELVTPRLKGSAIQRAAQSGGTPGDNGYTSPGESGYYAPNVFPFELEILEAALMVATGRLDEDLISVTRRVGAVLTKLPREITPVNLEELRRVKQHLVELESKAENLRDLLEELMDDEDEIIQLNLSSRPKREEKRRQRERDRLEREMEREWAERGMRIVDGLPATDPGLAAAAGLGTMGAGAAGGAATKVSRGPPSPSSPAANFPTANANVGVEGQTGNGNETVIDGRNSIGTRAPDGMMPRSRTESSGREESSSSSNSMTPGGNPGDRYEEAQDALEEMIEEEEEERELEEVEDLLEYYLQRAATTQSEAERLLAGARDLEESIGVSLSARRFEVNRLELLLSMASFAAALGAMVASIFGMNLRSTLENSVIGFWGTTWLIVAGSAWVFWILYKYSKAKRVL